MYRRTTIVISIALLVLVPPALSRSQGRSDSSSAGSETASIDSTGTSSLGMLMLRADEHYRSGLTLQYSARPAFDTHALLGGYRVYRASPYEMALRGAGAGMTMGAMAGAMGMMTDAWDEDEAWYVAGAAAALGAIFGISKSDDPEWNIRIRWDPDR